MINLHEYKPSEADISNPVWWKDNSPEGTTHYLPDQPAVARAFIKEDGDILYYSYGHGFSWIHWGVKKMKSCYKLIERPKEKKGMKGSDKVMVELTGYQVAKLYAVLGSCNGGLEYETRPSLYSQARDLLGLSDDFWVGHFLNKLPLINFYGLEENLYKAVLEPENPVLTEAQKKALELKETIAKAQKQLEELEKEI